METSIAQLSRYKVSVPFSMTLNEAIISAFKAMFTDNNIIAVHFVDFEPYADFDALKADINTNNRLLVSTLHSDNTIFGFPGANHLFRAVHDFIHYKYNLDFSYESELLVNYYQNSLFKKSGLSTFDLDLLNIETAGQIAYHKKTGNFPVNQRLFTLQELTKMGY